MTNDIRAQSAPIDILRIIQVVGGFIALAALLLYTWVHTGALLANYIKPGFVGYVAAVGIELAVVILSLSIGQARRTGRDTGFFYFVLVSAAVVSVIANVSEGFRADQDTGLSTATWEKLDWIQWFIAVTATGLISLIVLALSEIIGTGVQGDALTPATVQTPTETTLDTAADVWVSVRPTETYEPPTPDTGPDLTNHKERKAAGLLWLSGHPGADEDTLVAEFNISPKTARRWLDEWRASQPLAVSTNGNGAH